mmetsp:Transcript_15026/g.46572  ORF Transcript_15026/g.46572 Transcript_15026/m.46572 type:complete len:249 (-) Transcript_15026:161-907(-)
MGEARRHRGVPRDAAVPENQPLSGDVGHRAQGQSPPPHAGARAAARRRALPVRPRRIRVAAGLRAAGSGLPGANRPAQGRPRRRDRSRRPRRRRGDAQEAPVHPQAGGVGVRPRDARHLEAAAQPPHEGPRPRVHRQPAARQQPQVRPPDLRRRHELQPAACVRVPRGARALRLDAIPNWRRRHRQMQDGAPHQLLDQRPARRVQEAGARKQGRQGRHGGFAQQRGRERFGVAAPRGAGAGGRRRCRR